jgi:serine/threonine protein kinase
VYEIVARREPFSDKDPLNISIRIRDEGLTPTIPKECPVVLRDVMQMCWKKDPEQRPTMEVVLAFLERAMSQPETTRESETIAQSANSLLKRSQITFTELTVERKIGTGSYGKVCLGKWNAAPVALKFCRKKGNLEDFMREIRLMIELPPHPNVVHLFGVSLDGQQPIIVLEYCAGGSLDKLLFQTNITLSDEQKMRLVRGIAAGMLHLHKHNIVHRDLAARNILLTASGDPKISDFGMSRILEKDDEGKTNSTIGPVCWMAPESLAYRNYSKKSDVWTFGIVVYEIVAQREPHKDQDLFEVGSRIRDEGLTPTIPTDCPPKLRELMQMRTIRRWRLFQLINNVITKLGPIGWRCPINSKTSKQPIRRTVIRSQGRHGMAEWQRVCKKGCCSCCCS